MCMSIPVLSQSIDPHSFGATELFCAPKLTDLRPTPACQLENSSRTRLKQSQRDRDRAHGPDRAHDRRANGGILRCEIGKRGMALRAWKVETCVRFAKA